MVNIIDKDSEAMEKEKELEKLVKVIEQEIVGKNIKYSIKNLSSNYLDINIYKVNFRRLRGICKEGMMCITKGISFVEIKVINNDYMQFAKKIGEKIEEDFGKEYGKEVRITYDGRKGKVNVN